MKGSDPLAMSHEEGKDLDTCEEPQTASDYINNQLQLEADAREALPYAFDSCSAPLGPLRQTLFSCTTCNPPPASPAQVYTPAGICYACSISCHGDHTLVELFSRRNFVCDCGSTRMPTTSPCTLRTDPVTGLKGVHSQEPAKSNRYSHNFQNRFCGCGSEYDVEQETGTMFQCLGLGTVESGGCGEDWWHPECLMGIPRERIQDADEADLSKKDGIADAAPEVPQSDEDQTTPPGFPDEDEFAALLCYKCIESNPWIKQYAGGPGLLPPLFKQGECIASNPRVAHPDSNGVNLDAASGSPQSKKRKRTDDMALRPLSPSKRIKEIGGEVAQGNDDQTTDDEPEKVKQKHDLLPATPPQGTFSLFLKEDFRDHLCHCPRCYPNLIPHPQLREEEDTYQPATSESGGEGEQGESNAGHGSGTRSHGTGSLLERGEAALNTIDRVRAIEGVMVYNQLKDKVKGFLKPYAESGEMVRAEDIKAYFEKLRGDDDAIREASNKPSTGTGDGGSEAGGEDQRREQSGY